MADRAIPPIEVVLPGREDFEWMAIRSAELVAARMGFTRERIEDVKTVVAEAFLNAVQHGNRGRANRKVAIRYRLESHALCIDIVDRGRGFDPQRIPEPRVREKMRHRQPPGGWGLFLMRRLTNRLEVRRCFPFGSCVRLEIRPELGEGSRVPSPGEETPLSPACEGGEKEGGWKAFRSFLIAEISNLFL